MEIKGQIHNRWKSAQLYQKWFTPVNKTACISHCYKSSSRESAFPGVWSLCCSPGRCCSSVFCGEEQIEPALLCAFLCKVEGAARATTRNGPRASCRGSRLWQSHKAAVLPPRNAGWVCCARQPRTKRLHNARLCSVIHYSELLNNSVCRNNGICHWNTFHMEAGSLQGRCTAPQPLSPCWGQQLFRSAATQKRRDWGDGRV